MHVDDLFGALVHLASRPQSSGACNLAAPEPVTNRQFARDLGRVLHRPSFLPVPVRRAAARWELADVLLKGQRVLPHRLLAEGFTFLHPGLEDALGSLGADPVSSRPVLRRFLPLLAVLGGLLALFALPMARSDCCLRSIFNRKPGGESSNRYSSLALALFVDFVRYFSKPADHPGGVFSSWFCWLFLALLLFDEVSRRRQSPGARTGRLAGVLRQLRRSAFVMGLLLCSLVFIRWPAMKPVAPSADWLLVNIHTHSQYSWDSMTSPEQLLAFAEDFGFDAFVVTDHDSLEGARKTQALTASRGGPVVLPGSEIRGWPKAHYLFIGLQEPVDGRGFRENPQAAVAAARRQGASVILSKWWTKTSVGLRAAIDYPLSGMEVYNLAYGLPSLEKRAKLIAASPSLSPAALRSERLARARLFQHLLERLLPSRVEKPFA